MDLDEDHVADAGAGAADSQSKNIDIAFIKVNPDPQNLLRKHVIIAIRVVVRYSNAFRNST